MRMGIFRYFCTSTYLRSSSKSPLAILRERTGLSFVHCRKALEMHGNNTEQAEKWLKEQAKELGLAAALKLQKRRTSQGLIGIAMKNKKISVVEVNCETDFVAKNEKFKSLVELVAKSCLKLPVLTPGLDTNKIILNSEELGNVKVDNMPLSEHMTLVIGSMGENMILRQAFCYETSREDVKIACTIHPPAVDSPVLLGKYGSFISFQRNEGSSTSNEKQSLNIASELCKHIIGMDPVKIGEYGKDEPVENIEEERVMIHQEFLSDTSLTVGEVLKEYGMKILDYKRFECGQLSNQIEENHLDENKEEVNVAG